MKTTEAFADETHRKQEINNVYKALLQNNYTSRSTKTALKRHKNREIEEIPVRPHFHSFVVL